jgi:hypothetical protein
MRKILLMVLFCATGVQAGSWNDVNEALVKEDWGLADIHLEELEKKRLSSRERYNLLLNKAWVKFKLGLSGEAKQVLAEISRLDYSPNELEALNLHDTLLTVKYDRFRSLPPVDKRIIIDSSDNSYRNTDYLYSALSATTWTRQKVNDFLTIDTDITPFLKPIAPKLFRGEFEKPEDFIVRVEDAQNEYKSLMEKFYDSQRQKKWELEQKIEQRKAFLPTIGRLYTQAAIKKTIGTPQFELSSYNAISEYFPGRITPSKDTDLFNGVNIAINEPIQTAPNLKSLLRQAKPILVFSYMGQDIQLSNVLLELSDGRVIEATMIDKEVDQQFASYQVPEIVYKAVDDLVVTGPSSIIEGKTEVLLKSLDPEIMRLKTALSKAELANNQAVIARL